MSSYLQIGRFWGGEHGCKAAEARPEMRTGEPAYSAVMSRSDPTAVLAEMKRTEALLRDARSVLLRVDALAAKASTSDDPSRVLIAEVRTACEHLVSHGCGSNGVTSNVPICWRFSEDGTTPGPIFTNVRPPRGIERAERPLEPSETRPVPPVRSEAERVWTPSRPRFCRAFVSCGVAGGRSSLH